MVGHGSRGKTTLMVLVCVTKDWSQNRGEKVVNRGTDRCDISGDSTNGFLESGAGPSLCAGAMLVTHWKATVTQAGACLLIVNNPYGASVDVTSM
jgi:hypothetical protein